MKRRFITKEEIESKRTYNGGFTKKQLSQWGVPWPPPSGWKNWISENGIPYDGIEDLHEAMDRECDAARDRDRT
jgi:hypothetical protein